MDLKSLVAAAFTYSTRFSKPKLTMHYRLVGSHFITGFKGTTVTSHVRQLIEECRVGAILLASQNLSSAEQTVKLVKDLQQTAFDAGYEQPLLIAIDQENGGVNAIFDNDHIRQFPSALGIVATDSTELAQSVGRATARELSCLGINWLIGPVLDVLANPRTQPLGVRSMGDDPLTVAQYGVAFIKGYHEGSIAVCGKHFPSYGNLEFLGTPSEIPIVSETKEQLRAGGLIPFEHAIQAGLDSMLVGACSMSKFASTPITHACLAKPVVTDLLRQEMGFEGVIISDCLEIEALYENLGVGQAAIMGHNAGCDMLMICSTLSSQSEALSALTMSVAHGMILRKDLEASGARISHLKERYTSWETALNPLGIGGLQNLRNEHQKLSKRAYEGSISLVRDQPSCLPLGKSGLGGDLTLLTPLVDPFPTAHGTVPKTLRYLKGEDTFRELGLTIAKSWSGKVRHASYTASGIRPLHEDLIAESNAVVLLTADCGRNAYQYGFTKYISTLCKGSTSPEMPNGKPLVVVAVSSPYDFARDSQIGTYLCTYDFTTHAFGCLVEILFGKLAPTGTVAGLKPRAQSLMAPYKLMKPHQNWLVEEYDHDRDFKAAQELLEKVFSSLDGRSNTDSPSADFMYRNANSLLTNSTDLIDCRHLIVRNSSTKAFYGLCTLYVVKALMRGSFGCIFVAPERRGLGIAQSLHFRAMKYFLQYPRIREIQYGSDLPAIMPGVPISMVAERVRLSRWIKENGPGHCFKQLASLYELPNLINWTPLPNQFEAPMVLSYNFEVLSPQIRQQASLEIMDFISKEEHLSSNIVRSPKALSLLYTVALQEQNNSEIVTMRDELTKKLVGTALLHRANSVIAKYFPLTSDSVGAISSIACGSDQQLSSFIGMLIAFATMQIKIRGFSIAQVRVVLIMLQTDDYPPPQVLENIGYRRVGEYESFICNLKI